MIKKITLLIVLLAFQIIFAETLIVQINGFKNTKGNLMLAVFDEGEYFPNKPEKAIFKEEYKISDKNMEIEIPNLKQGVYAISVYHDENLNSKFDMTWYFSPEEGYGTSNDAKGSFGPPKFDDAKFEFKKEKQKIVINLEY